MMTDLQKLTDLIVAAKSKFGSVEVFDQMVISHGDPAKCFIELVSSIMSGTIDDEFKADPKSVIAKIACVIGGLFDAIANRLVDDEVEAERPLVFGQLVECEADECRMAAEAAKPSTPVMMAASGVQPSRFGGGLIMSLVLKFAIEYITRFLDLDQLND